MSFAVLPSDSPCQDCVRNCCDPVALDSKLQVLFPVLQPGQDFNVFSLVFEQQRFLITTYIRSCIEDGIAKCEDRRFRFRGVVLTPDKANPHDHFETTVTSDGFPFDSREMILVRVKVRVLFDCDAFDRESRACTRYDTRPPVCQDYSPRFCGFSRISEPMYDITKSQWYTPETLIARRDASNLPVFLTPEAAVADLQKRLEEKYFGSIGGAVK